MKSQVAAAVRGRRKQWIAIAVLVILGVVGAGLILTSTGRKKAPEASAAAAEDEHGHGAGDKEGGHADEKVAKGPNGGELQSDGDVELELLLSEAGGVPKFKAWLRNKGQPMSLAGTRATITLIRASGERQTIQLQPSGDSLASPAEVAEPHVFEATVEVQTAAGPSIFTFSKTEGKVEMSDAQVQSAGITLDTSGAANIRSTLQLPGEIRFNEDRTAHIVPRVGGIVERVQADLGQRVRKGQVLAIISSNQVSETRAELQTAVQRRELARSTYEREKKLWAEKISPEQDVLQARQALREAEIAASNASQKLQTFGAASGGSALGRYELRAPFDGIVVEKHITLGEAVREDTQVFTISDLSTVWAEISVPARDLPRVRVGEKVQVRSGAFDASANGVVAYVGSLIGEQTRTARARVTLPNPNMAWRPGLFVNVDVLAEETTVPVTVSSAAIQTVDEKPVVFMKVPGGFVAQPVEVGRSDGKRVEIVRGLPAGSSYAAAGSFVVKSEQGKGSATHAH